MDSTYKVYVLPDEDGRITAINSDEFLPDLTGWELIDAGEGDRYHHAQNNYFPMPIVDDRGVYRYKLLDGTAVERTAEEMDADYLPPVVPEPEPGQDDSSVWDELDAAYREGVNSI